MIKIISITCLFLLAITFSSSYKNKTLENVSNGVCEVSNNQQHETKLEFDKNGDLVSSPLFQNYNSFLEKMKLLSLIDIKKMTFNFLSFLKKITFVNYYEMCYTGGKVALIDNHQSNERSVVLMDDHPYEVDNNPYKEDNHQSDCYGIQLNSSNSITNNENYDIDCNYNENSLVNLAEEKNKSNENENESSKSNENGNEKENDHVFGLAEIYQKFTHFIKQIIVTLVLRALYDWFFIEKFNVNNICSISWENVITLISLWYLSFTGFDDFVIKFISPFWGIVIVWNLREL